MILHLVTDRRRLAAAGGNATSCLIRQVRFAVQAGVDVVQIRELGLAARDLTAIVEASVDASRGTSTRIVVNDRLDVALAGKADGVHLRGDSVPADRVRALAPERFLIGRSVHSVHEAQSVAASVTYLIAGTVWPSPSKSPGAPLLGLAGLAELTRAVDVPVLAIGGVAVDRAAEAARAGAAGVAAIGLFIDAEAAGHGCGATPLEQIVRALRARFDTPSRAS